MPYVDPFALPLMSGSVMMTATGTLPVSIVSGQVTLSGSITTTVGVTQTAQNVSSSSGVKVFNFAPVGVSASVPLQVWQAGTVGVSGSLTVTPSVTQTAQNVSSSSGVRVFNTGDVGVSGSVSILGQVSVNNFPAIQNVSGTVGVVIENWPATIGVTASAPIEVFSKGTVGISGSVTVSATGTLGVAEQNQLKVSNFPAVQAISGGIVVQNWPASLGISASIPLQVWNASPVGVTASVALRTWDGGIQGVSASVPISVWNAGTVGVSGTVAVSGQVSVDNFPATQNISGTVGVNNFPATQNVSGGIVVQNWPLNVGVTGSVNVYTSGLQGVSGTVGVNNFPATQNISGTVTSIIGNWPATLGVSASVNFHVWDGGTQGVSGSVNVYTSGPQAVSGTVQVWTQGPLAISGAGGQIGVSNFPATQNVSGTITVGSFAANVTASIQGAPGAIPVAVWNPATVGVSGSLTVTPSVTQTAQNVSSSSGVRVWNDVPVGVSGSVNVYTSGLQGISGTISVNNYPATQNVSGTVGVNNFPAVQAVSGGIVVQNWPAVIGVSASVALKVYDTGVTSISGSQLTGSTFGGFPVVMGGVWVASASGGPQYVTALQTSMSGVLFVSASNPVLVWNQTPVGVTGSVNVYTSGLQGISGSVTLGAWAANTTGSVTIGSSTTAALTGTIALSGSNFLLLNGNSGRKNVLIHNGCTVPVWIAFASTCNSGLTGYSFQLNSQQTFQFNAPPVYTGIITCAFTLATGSIRVTEFT